MFGIPVQRTQRPVVAVGLLLAVVGFLSACEEQLSPFAFVRNETAQAIDVYQIVDGTEELVISLDKPLSASFDQELFDSNPEQCTSGDLVARTLEGEEVARLAEQLCVGDLWVIEKDGTSTILRRDS
jgi:hypothetical protein